MVDIAVGLALTGKTAVCGTFACFASQRACDQITLLAHVNANVKIIGMEPALVSGSNGATHQGVFDLAVMRAMPNMTVFDPGDATETTAVMRYMLEHPGPAYLRVVRGKSPVILDPNSYQFQAGKAARVREGSHVAVIACGIMLPRALAAAEQLAAEGISARVVSMASIKPLDEEEILAAARDIGCIVTAENHHHPGRAGQRRGRSRHRAPAGARHSGGHRRLFWRDWAGGVAGGKVWHEFSPHCGGLPQSARGQEKVRGQRVAQT